MFQKVTTLTEFILEEERKSNKATGSLTLLLTQIENAGKIIASHIKRTGLVDILGKTGSMNTYGEEVQKLDEYANSLLVDTLLKSNQVHTIFSEELEKPVFAEQEKGHYDVFIDPLDGSSNIDINVTVGTIFSIYREKQGALQKGTEQVAAGYILYGSSVMFVFTTGHGVNGFTLDPSIGSFLLSHPDIKIPQSGSIYSINEAYMNKYDKNLQNYIHILKKDGVMKLRYIGSMVADVHRTLLKGGIFLYPNDTKNKEGKLRLMFEVNPLSFIMEQAGGQAVSRSENPLTIDPLTIEQRVPVVLGSPETIKEFVQHTT